MTQPWYVSAFGESYSDLYHHRNESDARQAVDFVGRHPRLASFLQGPSGRVLDLCCGSGRHCLTWLDATQGRSDLVGLDLSPNLLREAAAATRHNEVPLKLVRGDMRHLPFRDGAFRLVLNLFTSFGYFEADAENAGVFHEVARVLDRSGYLLFDHLNPAALRAGLVAESRRQTASGTWVRETRRIDEVRRRVEKRIEFESSPPRPPLFESVRFYEPEEVTGMADLAGLELLSTHGGFDASPLTKQSPRALYVFQKRV